VTSTWPAARHLGGLEREDQRPVRPTPRRLVIELTIVAIAVGGAVLLAQRGLVLRTPGQPVSFDPLLAAVPVLVGLAAGIAARRLYPLPIAVLGWLAARRRDAVAVLGLRTLGRDPGTSTLALVVLLVTAAFGAFSSVIGSTIDRGLDTSADLSVGADYRIQALSVGALPAPSALAALPGVEVVAPAYVETTSTFISDPSQLATTDLDAVDAAAYASVTAGTPAEPHWPGPFLVPPPVGGVGTDAAPIPAILSTRLPNGSSNLVPGATFTMTIGAHTLVFRLVEQRAMFPGLGNPSTFAVVPLDWIQAAFPGLPRAPTVIWLRAPASAADAIATTVAGSTALTRVDSAFDSRAGLEAGSLISVVSGGYGLSEIVAASYMALAVLGAMVLSAARRSRDLAYLRTLGFSRRQALGLTIVEQGPTILLALVAGVALGLGLAVVLEPGLGLESFPGLTGAVAAIDWPAVAVMVAVLVGVIVVAIVAGTWLSRRAPLMDALRIGDA
jgi:putative ABC transport system permease protein